MFFRFKKNKNNHSPEKKNDHGTPTKDTVNDQPETSSGTSPDISSSEPAVQQRQFWNSGMSQSDWLDEMVREQEKKGAFDHLPDKGKPLQIQSGDVFAGILKNANVLPDWLSLQHEIREHIQKLLAAFPDLAEDQIQREIVNINMKITKYNTMVPTSILQKRRLTRDNMEEQYQLWV